jgi:pimeloyl-ACP methyl ester carboxylesterase
MDHYADDLAAVVEHLDLRDVVHIGHSTGGGEVVNYLARHGESRAVKAALISAEEPQQAIILGRLRVPPTPSAAKALVRSRDEVFGTHRDTGHGGGLVLESKACLSSLRSGARSPSNW